MNRKGFAITAVIYGLAILGILIIIILMGTLSSTRNNVSEEAKMVEEFLISFNQTEVTYRGTTDKDYRIPIGESGWYRIEAFGAGNGTLRGAYTTGIIYFNEKESIHIHIDNSKSEVTMATTILMRAMAASALTPGGTNYCYSGAPAGGSVNMNTYVLNNYNQTFTGIDGITFTSCGSNASYVLGHPSSSSNGTYNYYFVDGLMLGGANQDAEGKIIIQRLAEKSDEISTIPRKNSKFDGVTGVSITTGLSTSGLVIRYLYHDGYDANGHFVGHVGSCSGTTTCNFPSTVNLDDVSIMFTGAAQKANARNTTVVLKSASGDRVIYKADDRYGITTGSTGLHFSAYQPDSVILKADGTPNILSATNSFPDHGNYYLIPVVSENMLVSAVSASADDANQLKIEYFTGESRQKWAIDLINAPGGTPNFPNVGNATGKKEYRLTELTRYKSLNIYYDENYKMNFVSASETFNSLSRNEPQIWNIYPMSDGTFAIKTAVPSFSLAEKSGFLFAKANGDSINNLYDVMIGIAREYNQTSVIDRNTTPTEIERFFLYSLDFSK